MLFSRAERTDIGPDRRNTVMIGMVPSSQARYSKTHMNRNTEPQREEPRRRVLRVVAWLPRGDRDYASETSFRTGDGAHRILLRRLTIEHVWGEEKARLNALFSTKPWESAPNTRSTPISFSDLRGTDLYMGIMRRLGINIHLTLTGEDDSLCVSVRPPFSAQIQDFLTTAINAADWLNRQLHAPFPEWFASMRLVIRHQCLLTHVGGTDAAVWIDAGKYALWQRNLISDLAATVPSEIEEVDSE